MRNDEFEIRQLPLSVKFVRRQVESFLEQNGLRLEPMDYYAAVFEHGGEEILAGGGLSGNVIKCIAVKQGLRDAKLSLTMISHLISTATSYGIHHLKIFTKPENKRMFESLGFQTIAQSEHAILQENDHSLADYKKKLRKLVAHPSGYNGIIIMNANPFTKGHRYLIEQAARQVEQLFVMVVEEDVSRFPYAERKAMVEKGCADLPHVTVCTTGSYAVSSATFPSYFLKEINLATDTQIMLDLDLFASQIAPTLNIKVRFVGSEPSDNLTRRYNELMKNVLPARGIEVKELPRLQIDHVAVSASSLRAHLQAHSLQRASALAYSSTIPYLIADLACQSLQEELDLTPKPGLVDQHDSGAHHDMDYELMNKSIRALRPYFVELALLGNEECRMKNEEWVGALNEECRMKNEEWAGALNEECRMKNEESLGANPSPSSDSSFFILHSSLPKDSSFFILHSSLKSIGLRAEKAMYEATKGVNTHKGALFSLGITIVVAAHEMRLKGKVNVEDLQKGIMEIARLFPDTKGTHGSEVSAKHHVEGALAHARRGYPDLFDKWLPFLINEELRMKNEESAEAIASLPGDSKASPLLPTLLYIMSMLDDTNVYYRKGEQVAQQVKEEAKSILNEECRMKNEEWAGALNEECRMKNEESLGANPSPSNDSSFFIHHFSFPNDSSFFILHSSLKKLNLRFISENISPGGSADMLSLTRLVQSLIS